MRPLLGLLAVTIVAGLLSIIGPVPTAGGESGCAAAPVPKVTHVYNEDGSLNTTITENYRGVQGLTLYMNRDPAFGSYVNLSVPEWLSDAYAGNVAAVQSDIDRGLLRDRRPESYLSVCRSVPSDQAAAHRADPRSVMTALMRAQMSGDVEAGVALFAEGASIVEDFRSFEGTTQVRSWLQWTADRGFRCELLSNERVSESSLLQVHRMSHTALQERDIAQVDVSIALTVSQGKITSYRATLRPDSMARVRAFNQNQENLTDNE